MQDDFFDDPFYDSFSMEIINFLMQDDPQFRKNWHSQNHDRVMSTAKKEFRKGEQELKKMIINNIDLSHAYYLVSILSMLTEAHATATYPLGGFIPLKEYDHNHYILKNFDHIKKMMDHGFDSYEKFLDDFKKV